MTSVHRATNPPGTTGATNHAGKSPALRRDGTMIELDAATIEAFAARPSRATSSAAATPATTRPAECGTG